MYLKMILYCTTKQISRRDRVNFYSSLKSRDTINIYSITIFLRMSQSEYRTHASEYLL